MKDTGVTNLNEDALYEHIRLMLFGVDLPVQRLKDDVHNIGRFTVPHGRSPQSRLVDANPPLTPAAEAIVRVMIRAYGTGLFGSGSANAALRAMIKAGPVAFARTALTLGPDAPVPEHVRPLVAAFNRIFERYPESGFSQARDVLSTIGLPVGRCGRSRSGRSGISPSGHARLTTTADRPGTNPGG